MTEDSTGILHYGLGPIGRAIAELVAARDDVVSVGAVDIDPNLAGAELADLLPSARRGVAIHATLEEALRSSKPSVVVHATTSSLDRAAPQILACVRAGLPVVSTCEELAYPWITNPPVAVEIDSAAARAGVAVLGTGVNPGFAMDYLPIVLAMCASAVSSVEVVRHQDATKRREPLLRKIGAGLAPDAFHARASLGTIRHVGLVESVHHLAAALNLRLEDVVEDLAPVIAERSTETQIGLVGAGSVAGVRQTARGIYEGEVVVSLDLIIAVGISGAEDRVCLRGDTPLELVIPGGIPGDSATAAIVINSVHSLLTVPPGLRVMADIPPHAIAAARRVS